MTIRRRTLLATGSAALLGVPAPGHPALAQTVPPTTTGREALLIPGKRTLRQRVLTRLGAAQSAQPGGPAATTAIQPMTPLYVFARQTGPDGKQWLEVGGASRGATLGWLPEDKTIPWLHTMTAAFTNPGGREKTLFFERRNDLEAMLGGTPMAEARQLNEAAKRRPRPANFPVLAVEPEEHVDIRRQFYLLPILQAESVTFQDGREYRMLEVASVPMSNDPPPPPRPFTVGFAFVVDTTLSMDPFINKVRAALTDFVKATAAEPGAPTRYALVGFRNSLAAQPRLEYLTRTFAKFADSTDADSFIRKIQDIRATNVDSLSFNEDSFAAIADAIDNLDWGDIQGRVIILVTDAGSRAATDPNSKTGMGPEQIGQKAAEAKVALMALHLRTPQGANNHAYAERQYTTITSMPYPALGQHYFPVPNGDANALDRAVREMLTKLRAVRTDQAADAARNAPLPDPNDRLALLGHAMRLAWLGSQRNVTTPDLLRAWAADGYRGANPPECLEVRVLLTRNQLNDLAQSMRFIIDQGRANLLDSNAMFDRLQTVAAHLARDPQALRSRGLENLGGILGEYLDGLPYVSDIATLDRATWRNMGGGAQTELLDNLEARLRLYQDFNRTPELWKSFDGGRDPGEAVYPVPLSALP